MALTEAEKQEMLSSRFAAAYDLYAVDNTPQVAQQTTVIAEEEIIDPDVACPNGQTYKQSFLNQNHSGQCPQPIAAKKTVPPVAPSTQQNNQMVTGITNQIQTKPKKSPFLFIALGIGIFLLLTGGK